FYDRSYNREILTFNTLQRQRTYEYEVKGNKPKFSDHGESWSEGVNPVTPFSVWEISLPDTSKNKEIAFDGLIAKVTLSFVLEARIHDTAKVMLRKSKSLLRAAAKPPIGSLLSQMSGKSVLNNWDVVFNMALDKINDVLKLQYEELKNNDKKYGGKISAETSIRGADIGDIKTYILQKFDMQYGYPKLQFLINDNDTGNLEMQITSGDVQKGTRYVGSDSPVNRTLLEALAAAAGLPKTDVKEETIDGKKMLVLQYYEKPTPLGTTATLQAVIKISQVKGLVNNNNNILSVVLDMQKGAFAAKNIEIEMNDEQRIAFSEAVKAYFVNHPVFFIINSLDLTGIATLADLKPNQFLFKAFKSQSGNEMLQLFIQTNNREAFNYSQTYISSDVSDPIPEGAESSLMINSRIFFGSVLPQSMVGGWTFKGNDPGNTSKAWNGSFSSGTVQGDVDLSRLDSSYTPPRSISTTYTSYSPSGGNPVSWGIDGMTIDSGANGQMTMNYNQKKTFFFDQSSKTCSIFGCTDPSVSKLSTDITLNISASLPTKVGGSGQEQTVKIDVSDKAVGVEARTSGGGPCGSDDLQSQVNQQLKSTLPNQVTSKINVSFKDVSVFALQNLLFPSKNRLSLQSVYVPGDLLILGNFTTGS
ncbi:MAG: hypothetical protein M3384_12710, partial [Acidobacteriota bacterium]|nr:hypothetical protein [Acidobacteriota bacterium]